MRPIVKAGLAGAGYIAAFAIALAVVGIHMAATDGSNTQSSGGMSAFGDCLLFVAVFGVAAVPATCLSLFFLRQCSPFWLVLSFIAPVTAVTGLAALIDYVVARTPDPHSAFYAWSGIALLRILAAPLFGLAFLLCGIFAPSRSSRTALLIATAGEAIIFCCIIFVWLRSSL